MKQITRTKVIPEQIIPEHETSYSVWVASDGTEFDSPAVCKSYEEDLRFRGLKQSTNVMVCDKLEDEYPFDGEYHDDETYSYLWIKPLNGCGIDEIYGAFPNIGMIPDSFINKWMCIEYGRDDVYVSLLEDSIGYVRGILKTLSEIDPNVLDLTEGGVCKDFE